MFKTVSRVLFLLPFCFAISGCESTVDLDSAKDSKAEPYSEFYDYEYSNPNDSFKLGSPFSKDNKALKETCLNSLDQVYNIRDPYSTSTSWHEVTSSAEILSEACRIDLNKPNYVSILLGEKTKDYISKIKFNDHTFTYFAVSCGFNNKTALNPISISINEDAINLLKTDPAKFEERFGTSYCTLVVNGFCSFSVETYEISSDCKLSLPEAHKMLNNLKSFGNSVETTVKLEKALKIPGIKKHTYNFCSQNIDPSLNITTIQQISDYIYGLYTKGKPYLSPSYIELAPYQNILNYPKQ